MSSIFGIEAPRAVIYVIAFAIILGLVALFGVVLRKLTGARLALSGNDRGRSRQPRLGIVDIYDLDRQRQLVLLRRDNVEHLLLIGGLNDVVIETNIVRVAGARLPAATPDAAPERYEPTLDQAPRPQAEAGGRPSIEAQLAAQLGSFTRRPAEESDLEEELAPVASMSAPVAAHPEPMLKPDAVNLNAPPIVTGLRSEARSAVFPAAPLAPEPPAPRSEPRPAFTPPPFQARPTPVAPPPLPPAPPAPPAPPLARAPESMRPPQLAPVVDHPAPAPVPAAGPDAAILSDMAKQLEEALKRPAAPVPPPVMPHPIPPRVIHDEVPDEDDLLEPVRDQREEDEGVAETHRDEPAAAPEPVRPAPAPIQAVSPPPAAPRVIEPADASGKAPDPFSVEEIEAEFARLLGRPRDGAKKE